MKRITNFLVVSTVSAVLSTGALFAQDRDDHRDDRDNHHDTDHRDMDHHDGYVRHDEWKKGYHMRHEDWDRGQRVDDWRAHHLRQPPRGYEWREVDGNYVMAAVATGVIATVIAANAGR